MSKPVDDNAKRKRTKDPGVRVQGGRIYDSATGTTCHQCRQKTVEQKAKCTECTLWWCPRCLLNRYGEDVAQVSAQEVWPCPRCRNECNCSNCRKKRGLDATGILANVCKTAGISSVAELLVKNPKAKHLSIPKAAPQPKEAKPAKVKTKRIPEPNQDLLPDESLGERPEPLPASQTLRIHRPSKGTKRQRGIAWPASWPDSIAIPDDCSPGDLVEIIEFLQVYQKELKVGVVNMSCLAAELVQAPCNQSACAEDGSSPVGKIHTILLDLIRNDWGIKGTVGAEWQSTMLAYLKQDKAEGTSKMQAAMQSPMAAHSSSQGATGGDEVEEEASGACEASAVKQDEDEPPAVYPEGGYWQLPAACRLRMLRAVCHDSLATSCIRDAMTSAMTECAQGNKEKREALAAARREAKETWQEERNKKIASMIAGGSSWTLEEQKELMDGLKGKMEDGEGEDTQDSTAEHQALRILALGQDREGHVYWKLSSNSVFAGGENMLVARPWNAVDDDHWVAYPDHSAILKCLDERGTNESKLKEKILQAFPASVKSAGVNIKARKTKVTKPKQKSEKLKSAAAIDSQVNA